MKNDNKTQRMELITMAHGK